MQILSGEIDLFKQLQDHEKDIKTQANFMVLRPLFFLLRSVACLLSKKQVLFFK